MALTFNLIAVCVFIGTALSADQHCCVSKRWFGKGLLVTATLQNGSSTPTMTQNSFYVEQDLDKKMQRVNGSVLTENSAGQFLASYQVIRDFNHRKSYSFNETHCQIDPILGEDIIDGCVPKSFTLYGTYVFGSGNESARVNGWVGTVGGEAWTMTTTVNDCTPVSYTRIGTQLDGSSVSETLQLADVVQFRLSSDHVFDIPTICRSGAAVVG